MRGVIGAIAGLVASPLVVFGACPALFVGIGLALAWDRRPDGWPNAQVNVAIFHPHVGFGRGLRADRDWWRDRAKSWSDALDQCHANTRTLQGMIDAQNKAITDWSAIGARAVADSERALKAMDAANARALSARDRIMAPLPTGDVCARAIEVDRRFVESLP